MVKLTKLNNGEILRISWIGSEDDKAEVLSSVEENGSNCALLEILEPYACNGWGIYEAGNLGQMSDCFVICEDSTMEEDGHITIRRKAWSNIHNYMEVNEVEEILEKGYYDFYLWEDFGEEGENFKI